MARRDDSVVDGLPRRVADPDAERVLATRELLFDTAERLFTEQGYDSVSVRAINAAAGLNPGAIHYHFGSKQGLVVALLESRLPALRASLGEATTIGDDPDADIGSLVRLAVEPLVALARRDPRSRLYVRLLARAFLSDWVTAWSEPAFRTDVWIDVAARALPHLPRQEVAARWSLAIRLVLVVTGRPLDADPDAELDVDTDAIVRFVTGGMVAPMDGSRGRPRRRTSG